MQDQYTSVVCEVCVGRMLYAKNRSRGREVGKCGPLRRRDRD